VGGKKKTIGVCGCPETGRVGSTHLIETPRDKVGKRGVSKAGARGKKIREGGVRGRKHWGSYRRRGPKTKREVGVARMGQEKQRREPLRNHKNSRKCKGGNWKGKGGSNQHVRSL